MKFLQEGAPNNPAKRPFLRTYEAVHSLAYCQAGRGVAVELTQHGDRSERTNSPYQLLLNGEPPGAEALGDTALPWGPIWRESFGCVCPRASILPDLQAQFWYDAPERSSRPIEIKAVLVPVADLARSMGFWQDGLGCTFVARGTVDPARSWGRVAFRAPLTSWSLDLVLAEERNEITLPLLDAPGFACLALLTTSLERDAMKLEEAGARDATSTFQVSVGGKVLNIVMLRGPDGELIELVEVQRGPSEAGRRK